MHRVQPIHRHLDADEIILRRFNQQTKRLTGVKAMTGRGKGKRSKGEELVDQSRHNFIKGSGVVAGGLAAAAVPGS